MIFLGLAGAMAYVICDVSKDLPDYKQLASYEPAGDDAHPRRRWFTAG